MTAHGGTEPLPDVGTVDDEEPVVLQEIPGLPADMKAANRHLRGSWLPKRFRKGAK